jgi:hypothetical protein
MNTWNIFTNNGSNLVPTLYLPMHVYKEKKKRRKKKKEKKGAEVNVPGSRKIQYDATWKTSGGLSVAQTKRHNEKKS